MAPQASRRFHEAGVGSRTGLRLSAVARDQDGFEDLEAFYKASEAALDHRQSVPEDEEEAEDDYDSFDETRFSRKSGVNGRQAAAASSSMDIQNSSAPSPRSMLRSARQSAATPRKAKASASNVTLADDDDDDLDLLNLSTGSRSFDLGGMGGDGLDEEEFSRPPATPKRGLSARQAGASMTPKAAGKGKEKAITTARGQIDLSDSEDDRILADLRQRIDSEYGNHDDMMSDYDEVPVSVPSPRVQPPKPKSPARTAGTKRVAQNPAGLSSVRSSQIARPQPQPPASTSHQTQSPRRKAAKAAKARPREPEPEPEPMYEAGEYDDYYYDEPAPQSPKRKAVKPAKTRPPEPEAEPMYEAGAYDDYYDEPAPPSHRSPSPVPEQPPKRKRGRPPKSATTNGASTQTKAKPKAFTTTKSSTSSKTKRNPAEVVEKVRSQPTVTATVYDENGIRRSTRQRFAPLEYWRGERIRYGRPSLPSGTTVDDLCRRPGEDEFEDDPSMMIPRRRVPVLDIKEVIRVPRAPGEGTFAGTTARSRSTASASSRKIDRKSQTPRLDSPEDMNFVQLDPTADTVNVEDGWDANTLESGLVIDDSDGNETNTSVVRTKASLRPIAAAGQEFKFEKLFNCGGLMATGVLHLPPGTRKPTKPSKDNSFVFCVLQGALRATVHRKSFIVGPEGVFQVPAGNNYSLENVCERNVKLFFAQCRKTRKVGEGDLTTWTQVSDTSYGTPRMGGMAMPVLGGVGGRAGGGVGAGMAAGVAKGRGRGVQEQAEESEEEEEDGRGVMGKVMSADSDAEESEQDDFETSRQVKSKKRVFRRI